MTHKIHVGNIPFLCSHSNFEQVFKNYEGYIGCQLVKYKNSKLNKGFGFVEFDSLKNCIKILNNEITIGNRIVKCNYYIKKDDNPFQFCKNAPISYINDQIENFKCLNSYIHAINKIEQMYKNYTNEMIMVK